VVQCRTLLLVNWLPCWPSVYLLTRALPPRLPSSAPAWLAIYLPACLQKDVVYSYVVESPADGNITDLLSFYTLPSSVIGNDQYDSLKVRVGWFRGRCSAGSTAAACGCYVASSCSIFAAAVPARPRHPPTNSPAPLPP
jgi:hypothetical protein